MSPLQRNFREDFDELVAAFGDRTAIIAEMDPDPVTFTYSQLAALVERCAASYAQHGLRQGDRVLALMPNSVEMLVAALAAMGAGLGFAPLPCTASADETRRWAKLVGPRLVLATPALGDGGRTALDEIDVTRVEVGLDAQFDWLPQGPASATASASTYAPGPGQLFLATSGTTGQPSAIVLDTDRLWSSGCAFLAHHGHDWRARDSSVEGPRFWNYLPMSYLGGLFNLALIPLAAGGSIVISEPFSGKTFLSFWQTVRRFDIDALWFVPTIVRGLLQMSTRARSPEELLAHGARIQLAFLGTAPIDTATKVRFEETLGLTLLENFALSETTFITSEIKGELGSRAESSVGTALPYTEVKFVPIELDDHTGNSAPTEIRIKSPFMFEGYLQPDGTLDARLDEDGFLATGDVGHLEPDGTLVLDGRRRDAIKKGGYFVSLREIEVAAEGLDGVAEAAAVRVDHRFYGDSYVLYYIPDVRPAGDAADAEGVGRQLREVLNRYKWPEDVVSVSEFPRTSSGKVRKHLLGTAEGTSS